MNHRRGQRWQTDLAISIAVEPSTTPIQARLQDLSHHGARVHLFGGGTKSGKTIAVWLPKMAEPIRALVIHRRGGTLGLLWIEHSPWVDHTLIGIMARAPRLKDGRQIGQEHPAYVPGLAIGFGMPRLLPCLSAQPG